MTRNVLTFYIDYIFYDLVLLLSLYSQTETEAAVKQLGQIPIARKQLPTDYVNFRLPHITTTS